MNLLVAILGAVGVWIGVFFVGVFWSMLVIQTPFTSALIGFISLMVSLYLSPYVYKRLRNKKSQDERTTRLKKSP